MQYVYLYEIISIVVQSWRDSELDLTNQNDGNSKPKLLR